LGSLSALLRNRALAFWESHPAVDGFLFWSIARRDLPDCECVLRPSSEFVRELLRLGVGGGKRQAVGETA